MRSLKDIKEYCENLPPSRFKVHETGLEAGGITYVESGEYPFSEDMMQILVNCSEDLPRCVELLERAKDLLYDMRYSSTFSQLPEREQQRAIELFNEISASEEGK